MTSALFTHPDGLAHNNGAGHPERPERLTAILEQLDKPEYAALARYEAPFATIDQIARVHSRAYIEGILAAVPQKGIVDIDGETGLAPGSGSAALRAAGAMVAAVDLVLTGKAGNAFCAMRPPGHHAGWATTSGFCIFNNIAIGAAHALQERGIKRIAILDFDVHHGNGTQEWAEKQPGILFCSSHQWPLWPGSGQRDERGPLNNIINLPLEPGTDGSSFRDTMKTVALPAFERFAPELILISAGFDAHRDDPLASLNLEADDFFWITNETCRIARNCCDGRVISTLEGGYDLDALAASAGTHVRALTEN